ncbi:hypothetical protein FYJ51_08285 [Erysipelotrichaceae bacterium Oil+RF-744-GAM-WT-6]|jgi:hypothetical protein|uniref:SGNH hydrolase-type esterase domain-containing protein n=1 Tax=Stecheria intestinalis TaxID=2606630 RepID=A0A7X2NST3_9FIRM|nr:GDSL-type esterase/lipase family protein [Stecheria intestinalis]MCI2155049.1 GDSL-type esterase/lipase family protein [Solobacterium sp.]MSS58904.1 hypothetical protein [Stecheria intestinalis]
MKTAGKIMTAAAAIAGVYAAMYLGSMLTVEDPDIIAIYGKETAEPSSFQAELFGRDISSHVAVRTDLNPDRVGTYRTDYTLKVLGIPIRTVHGQVSVKDVEAPIITMADHPTVFTKIHEDCSLPAYTVTDNYDSPDQISVRIGGGADLDTAGTYECMLIASDTSGNSSSRRLTLIVGDIRDEDFQPGRFHLSDYDSSGVILRPHGDSISDQDFEGVIFSGDSNIVNMSMSGHVPSNQALARYAMCPSTFDLPVFYRNEMTYKNLTQWTGILKPDILILEMGLSEVKEGDAIREAEAYETCIDQLLNASEDTRLIICSLWPVRDDDNESGASQELINRLNYCLLKLCEKKGLHMIDADTVLKEQNGYGYRDYYAEDGYHLNAAQFPIFVNYAREVIAP